MLNMGKWMVIVLLLGFSISYPVQAQKIYKNFEQHKFNPLQDSLRQHYRCHIRPEGSDLELAALIALNYYPELKNNKFKIKHKENVRHPITASYSFWNVFKSRQRHTYILLIKKGSFVDRIGLNGKVGIIAHEMAHFSYYRHRPTVGMIPWGFRYITSPKFRYSFERDADKTVINRGLGWQLLEIAFYHKPEEIRSYMSALEQYRSAE